MFKNHPGIHQRLTYLTAFFSFFYSFNLVIQIWAPNSFFCSKDSNLKGVLSMNLTVWSTKCIFRQL